MKCTKCDHENEADARFCRNCGTQLTITKGTQVEFVPARKRLTTEDTTSGIVIGIVFIFVGLIIAVAILIPTFYGDFASTIGNFFGGFGETMGQIGSDFGEFMGNWGENFGQAVGSFFSGQTWWEILRIVIPSFFIIIGLIIVLLNYRKR